MAQKQNSDSSRIDIIVPEGVDGATVIEFMRAVGEAVEAEDSILAIETDKATAEIPAPQAGTLVRFTVSEGDKVSSSDVIAELKIEGASGTSTEEAPAAEAETPAPTQSSTEPASEIDITVPEGVDGATVIEFMKAVGDAVEAEDSILAIETDKATAEIPAPQAGTLVRFTVSEGDKVSSSDVIAKLKSQQAAAAPSSVPKPAEEPKASQPRPAAAEQQTSVSKPVAGLVSENQQLLGASVHASPSVRQFARELGADLQNILQPSGPKNRITFSDVKNWIKQALQGTGRGAGIPRIELPDFEQFGRTETVPLNAIKKSTGAHLGKSWLNVPMVTHFEETDISETEKFRKALNTRGSDFPKITLLSFIVKAVVKALQDFPQCNSSLSADGQSLILKKYYHIGIAVNTPRGLLVPVLKNADTLSIDETAAQIARLGEAGRNGKLTAKEMEGGSFTISSLGSLGGTNFTPLVNAPEAAILGVAKASVQPVWNGNEFLPRLTLPLSVSYDHRILDGGEVAVFANRISLYLSDLRHLIV